MALGERRVLDADGAAASQTAPPERARTRGGTVCWFLIVACGAVYLGEQLGLLPGGYAAGGHRTLQMGALYGPAVRAGDWWRVLGHVFEHGGVLHYVLNMSVVWTLGFSLERAIASWRFALVSIVTALGSAALALAFSYASPTVGASGMILGWAGAILPISTRAGRRSLLVWLAQIAALSIVPNLIPGSPLRISWEGHLGGFLLGLPCGFFLRDGARGFPRAIAALLPLAAAACIAGLLIGERLAA